MRATRILLLMTSMLAVAGGGWAAEPDPAARACDHGITLAFLGETARAESVFLWVLGQSRGDARALTNLGNLALLRGDAELAFSFYTRAADSDSADAGIVLNQATALMILGEEEAARERASDGIRLAGGAHQAGSLLGLSVAAPEDPSTKGAAKTYLSKDELTSLLRLASGHVPRDSTQIDRTAPSKNARSKGVVWRSAGARAGDQDTAALVYWKR